MCHGGQTGVLWRLDVSWEVQAKEEQFTEIVSQQLQNAGEARYITTRTCLHQHVLPGSDGSRSWPLYSSR
jgi:hypothetical protein